MDRAEQLSLLSGFAADQWGLVTSAQAKSVGLNGVQLLRLTEAALLENVGHGVYLLTSAGQPQHLEIKVAWLRLQPAIPAWQRSTADPDGGVISHASACQVQGLGDIPAPEVEISVPRRRATTVPSVRLRTVVVEPSDITMVDGLPVTTARRTILDLLAAKADGGHVGGVIAEAERRGLVSIEALAMEAGRFAHQYGMPRRSDGRALIEHLVSQAGERLHSDELERATRAGFDSALQLLGAQHLLAGQQLQLGFSPAIEDALKLQLGSAASVHKLLQERVLPAAQLQQAIAQSPAARIINEAIRKAAFSSLKLPPPIPLELHQKLQEAAQPSPAILQAIQGLQQPTSFRRAAEHARHKDPAPDQSAPPADGDDRTP